jgi:benzodiazapine receptor
MVCRLEETRMESAVLDFRLPLGLFLLQLLLNALWSPLFFGLHNPALGFADISLLWLVLLGTVAAFYRAHVTAGLLLVPYLAWVTFAAALNLTLWRLNS